LKTATFARSPQEEPQCKAGKHFSSKFPIAEAEIVLRQAAALAQEPEKTPALVPVIGCQIAEEFLKQQESNPSKGKP
jgi:hypothetical protein